MLQLDREGQSDVVAVAAAAVAAPVETLAASNVVLDLACKTASSAASAGVVAVGDYGEALVAGGDVEELVDGVAAWTAQDAAGVSGEVGRDGEDDQTVDIAQVVELVDSSSGWHWDCIWTDWACRRSRSAPEEEGSHVQDVDG